MGLVTNRHLLLQAGGSTFYSIKRKKGYLKTKANAVGALIESALGAFCRPLPSWHYRHNARTRPLDAQRKEVADSGGARMPASAE